MERRERRRSERKRMKRKQRFFTVAFVVVLVAVVAFFLSAKGRETPAEVDPRRQAQGAGRGANDR